MFNDMHLILIFFFDEINLPLVIWVCLVNLKYGLFDLELLFFFIKDLIFIEFSK